jgi:pSer/pThr/pTyr-binding forkhead associated (FHA) protein
MTQEPIKPTIKQNLSALPLSLQQSAPAQSPPAPLPQRAARDAVHEAAREDDSAQPFRPLFRPPVAILEICDDGADAGEVIRMRADSITIGRSNADVVIPHDSQISSTHARITRRLVGGMFQWFLTDLDSTNGTFIRVAKVALADGQLVLLGSHRYVFRAAQMPVAPPGPEAGPRNQTQGWQQISAADVARLTSTLVRLNPDGTEQSYRLDRDDLLIGQSSEACQIVLAGDPAVSRIHARVRRGGDGRFVLENANSRNGVWLGIREQRLHKSSHFQLGEQRFRLRVPTTESSSP